MKISFKYFVSVTIHSLFALPIVCKTLERWSDVVLWISQAWNFTATSLYSQRTLSLSLTFTSSAWQLFPIKTVLESLYFIYQIDLQNKIFKAIDIIRDNLLQTNNTRLWHETPINTCFKLIQIIVMDIFSPKSSLLFCYFFRRTLLPFSRISHFLCTVYWIRFQELHNQLTLLIFIEKWIYLEI